MAGAANHFRRQFLPVSTVLSPSLDSSFSRQLRHLFRSDGLGEFIEAVGNLDVAVPVATDHITRGRFFCYLNTLTKEPSPCYPPLLSYFACKEGSDDAGIYIIRVNLVPEIVIVAKPTHVVHFSLAYASTKIAV